MQILLYFLIYISLFESKIVIRDVGVASPSRGDIGMIFYVTLCNFGDDRYHVIVKMDKCCENFTKTDIDCHLMFLIGGDMGYIYPKATKNISLLYPNMYLHNRKGQCTVTIKYKNDHNTTEKIKRAIKFDTYIPTEEDNESILSRYYSDKEVTICETIDEDALEKCEPVDCHMKYLGFRNYFNYKCRRCQKVPLCVANPTNHTPDMIYYPTSNKCRYLKTSIRVEDLNTMEISSEAKHSGPPLLSENLRCHHGTFGKETGSCICTCGWMSAPVDTVQYEPSLFDYHMCNIEISSWSKMQSTRFRMTALIIAVLGATLAMFLVMLSCMCHLLYKCFSSGCLQRRKTEKSSSENEKFSQTSSFLSKGLDESSVNPESSTTRGKSCKSWKSLRSQISGSKHTQNPISLHSYATGQTSHSVSTSSPQLKSSPPSSLQLSTTGQSLRTPVSQSTPALTSSNVSSERGAESKDLTENTEKHDDTSQEDTE